jgi:predicted CXXCH cytochrome family protein
MANERELCYSCHDGTGASTDIRSGFGESTIGSSTKVSFHPVPQKVDDIQLVCSDCHTSHKPMAEDTKQLAVQVGLDAEGQPIYLYSPPDAPAGDPFCYACHGSGSTLPPRYRDFTRFDASPHDAIAAPDATGIVCLACHQPHGSDFQSLLRDDQATLCITCHDGTTGAFDPTSWASSTHATSGGLVCADCHDPHGTSNDFMLLELGGATGFDGTSATWAQLQLFCTNCHAEPTTAPHDDVNATQELCTDCHSHGSSRF